MKIPAGIRKAFSLIAHWVCLAQPWIYGAVPVVGGICLLAWCLATVRSDFDFDDANPEILNTAWRLSNGEDIYRNIDEPPYSFAAYTPLYYAVVALAMKFTGLSYLPAKLITLLCLLSLAWAMVALCRLWHKTPRDGIWTVCLCLLVPAILYNSARGHPQMMAVALSLWSLVFFMRDRWFPTLILSPLFAVLAFYTKQSQVALPIALVLYLALRKPRWLLPYAAVGTAMGLIPMAWIQTATEGRFLYNVLQLANLSYSGWKILDVWVDWVAAIALFFTVSLIILYRRFREGRWEPIDLYLACLLPVTLLSLGRAGSHAQYVVELVVVILLFLVRATRLPDRGSKEVLAALQVLALLCYSVVYVFLDEGPRSMMWNRAARTVYPILQKVPGPILSQQGSFALFTRGSIYIQLFHFVGLWHVGLWDHRPLLRDINTRKFAWVITQFPIEDADSVPKDYERFSPQILSALRNNYTLRTAVSPYYVYAPRAALAP